MSDISTVSESLLEQKLFGTIQIGDLIWAVILAAATLILARLATKALRHLLNRDANSLPSASIIVNIVRAAILIAGCSIILDSCFGVNTNSLIAALGVGGIAVSLGFQDTLSNLIGGLQVTFMGIVSPGDNIEVGGNSGVVQDITWRHTTIQDSLGQTVVIPNSIISKTALVHLLPANRVSVPFSVARYPQDTTADLDELAAKIIATTKQAVTQVSPIVEGPKVLFIEISELGIKGKVIFKVEDANATFTAADATVRAIATLVG